MQKFLCAATVSPTSPNGHATTQLIEAAHLPGPTDVWCDVLHEGPVPGDQSDEELVRTRARYLTSDAFIWGGHTFDELASELSHLRTVVDAVHNRDELVLWYEQESLESTEPDSDPQPVARNRSIAHPSLLCLSAPFRPGTLKGLGELAPTDIALLFEQRVRVTRAQCVLATHAWHAFRATDPRQIEAVLRSI